MSLNVAIVLGNYAGSFTSIICYSSAKSGLLFRLTKGVSDMNSRHTLVALGGLFFLLLFSACTFKATTKETTDTTSNITGTTSGRVWWNEDGLLKPEHKVAAFTAYKAQNLEEDLARGQGEYLVSLGALMGQSDTPSFQTVTQDLYRHWSQSGTFSTDELVSRVRTAPR
jgi:hypothetical protein